MAHANSSAGSAPPSSSIPASERVFGFRDQMSIWFSLGVGLLVMQVGAFLMPGLSPGQAALAIVVGSVLGASVLAFAARLGQETGQSSAGIIEIGFGSAFGKLPIILNVIQLLGWTAFEIAIMRDGTTAVIKQWTGIESGLVAPGATLLWGGILLLLMLGRMTSLVRRFLSRIGLPLVVVSLVWLTYAFVSASIEKGWDNLFATTGTGAMNFWGGIDLVIAMPISWLPLVADYARYSRTANASLGGTLTGYVFANIWCYALGVLVILNQPSGDLVTGLLLAQFGLIALSLIILDELDNAYGDLHSGAVSSERLVSGYSLKTRGIVLGVVSIGIATVLPMHAIEPFLLILSSIFVPLFGVILANYQRIRMMAQTQATAAAVYVMPVISWLIGVATYHTVSMFLPQFGKAIPTLIVAFLVAKILGRFEPEAKTLSNHARAI